MITAENVKEVFDYRDGKLYREGRCVSDNRPQPNGYVYVGYRKKKYLVHRVVWLWHNGTWPNDQIDHIDNDKTNNAVSNLRDVSQVVNQKNRGRPQKNSKLGVLGVKRHGRRYVARYGRETLGSYSTLDLAIAARKQAEIADPQHLRAA